MLEFAILGLLKEGPVHGYDLHKRLREGFGPLANLSFGSLYPALARLEASAAIRTVASEPAGASADRRGTTVPFTGSLGGERAAGLARRATQKAAAALGGRGTRARKVYEITERGEELFEQLLESSTDHGASPGEFTVRLAFARHLAPAARIRLLERRRINLADRLQRTDLPGVPSRRTLDRYERSIAEHGYGVLASELAWVEELLEEERLLLESQPAVHRTKETDADQRRVAHARRVPSAGTALTKEEWSTP